MDSATALLEIRGLTKSFGGPLVLSDVDFDVRPGEIHALLGANGAGKSTLIKILAGIHPADRGEISIRSASGAADPGRIAFLHQDLGLIESATVAENIALSCGFPRRPSGLIHWAAVRRRATEVLAVVACELPPDAVVATLGRTERSMIAIARAVASDPAILVLDEPTASLPSSDVETLFAVIRRLRDRGVGIIYVSHRLDEVFALTDRITVLRDGRVAATRDTDSLSMTELVRLIVGRAVADVAAPAANAAAMGAKLEVTRLVTGGVGPVSFAVNGGEIVGLVGLRGSGQEQVGRALAGVEDVSDGQVAIDGREVRVGNPAAARAAGVGFATSRREEESVAPTLTVGENAVLNLALAGRQPWQAATRRAERQRSRQVIDRFGVQPADPELPILSLSGGNQQKVVIGREMYLRPKVLVLEEPTMGVDIRSKAEIYRLLAEAAADGCSVLVVSTDPDDVVKLCHRALVMNRGRIVTELNRPDLTTEHLVQAISGHLSPARSHPESNP